MSKIIISFLLVEKLRLSERKLCLLEKKLCLFIIPSKAEAAWPALSETEGFNDNWGYRKAVTVKGNL